MSSPIRILVVSSVTPKPTGFGEILLHRHLSDEPRITVEVVPHPGISPILRLIRRTPFRGWGEAFEVLRQGRRWDQRARSIVRSFKPQVLLTVAAGDGCHAALRVAREFRVPVVTIFHDWWPDIVPRGVGAGEELRFRKLYQGSEVALCVSAGMRAALGTHPDARLLWPIPGKSPVSSEDGQGGPAFPHKGFRVFYAGNLREYAQMLRAALQVMKGDPLVRLEVRGTSPRWPVSFREEMRAVGMYHEFAPSEDLYHWLANANAFLVTSAFEPSMRRMMETNFPSKLAEFARFGRPLVLWGPKYSTLIQWGLSGSRGLSVTQADPLVLRSALENLATSPDEQQRLAAASRKAASLDFDPDVIQSEFMRAIQDAVRIPASRWTDRVNPKDGSSPQLGRDRRDSATIHERPVSPNLSCV